MLNQSLNELKLIAKSRGIKGYKRMSQNRLLSVLNASESVKRIWMIQNQQEMKIMTMIKH